MTSAAPATAGLAGKHVVITGASGGLGGAVLDAFVAAGASCHVPQRSAHGVSAANVRVVNGIDLGDEGSVAAFYATCPPLWASVHLAGGFAMGGIVATSLPDLRRQLDINVITAFLCCREAARNMQKQAGGGRIVNVTSRAAVQPSAGTIAYSIAKAGVSMLTQALAAELLPSGILVNAVAPSIIDTPTNRAAMPTADASAWPKPDDIARAILFLASPENRLTSGAILPVYGKA